MEINDGGEFASEDGSQMDTNGSDSEPGTEIDNSDSELEDGETSKTEAESSDSENMTDQNKPDESPHAAKHKKKKSSRRSMEQRLDTMSSTLLAVKELLLQQGIDMPGGDKKHKKSEPKKDNSKSDNTELDNSLSVTMIYNNVLEKLNSKKITDGDRLVQADSEVTFRIKENQTHNKQSDECDVRNTSSSDEVIDKSDELMDIDMDINDKFIADCAAEANRHKRPYPDEQEPDEDTARQTAKDHAERVIKNAEAAKIRMLGTPGNYNIHLFEDHFQGITAM